MFVEDLDAYFQDFGEAVQVGLPATDEAEMQAIFDDDFQVVNGDYVDVSSSLPVLTVKTEDVVRLGISHGTRIVVRTADYYVTNHQPDGTGMGLLFLRKG